MDKHGIGTDASIPQHVAPWWWNSRGIPGPVNGHKKPYREWDFLQNNQKNLGYPLVIQRNYGKSPCLMGKSTISTGPFSIAMLNFQRVEVFDPSHFQCICVKRLSVQSGFVWKYAIPWYTPNPSADHHVQTNSMVVGFFSTWHHTCYPYYPFTTFTHIVYTNCLHIVYT